MLKVITKEQIEKIINAHTSVLGTINYAKYEMCLEYKYLRNGKWTHWKYVAWTIPNNKGSYYLKKIKNKSYIMSERPDGSVHRYEVTPTIKELLDI